MAVEQMDRRTNANAGVRDGRTAKRITAATLSDQSDCSVSRRIAEPAAVEGDPELHAYLSRTRAGRTAVPAARTMFTAVASLLLLLLQFSPAGALDVGKSSRSSLFILNGGAVSGLLRAGCVTRTHTPRTHTHTHTHTISESLSRDLDHFGMYTHTHADTHLPAHTHAHTPTYAHTHIHTRTPSTQQRCLIHNA